MKVYIVSANWGGGGPGGIVKDLYNTLLEKGHIVRFGYCRGDIPKNINAYKFGTMFGVYIHAFLTRLFDKGGFYSTHATKRLIKDIIKFKPDIISIHNPLGYTINVPVLMEFVNLANVPTFYTLHDCWLFTGHCTTEVCEKLSKGCGKCPNKKEFPASFFVDRSKKNLLFKQRHFSNIKNLNLISCSKWIQDLANTTYLKNYNNSVINNGIDLDIFKYSPSTFKKDFNLENKRIVLGVASVWSKRKGQVYFCELLNYLDDNCKIVLVGRGLSKETKSHKEILCIEATDNPAKLAEIYSAADVFVNPTTGDNYPTVNLEAIACRTPVVTFDTGGSSEMIGPCGKVVKKGDIKQLADSIKTVLNMTIEKDVFIKQSKEFDKAIKYTKYIELFENSLMEKR